MSNYVYDATNTNSLVKAGDYEVTIERMERRTTTNGKEKISMMYRIREDVEQEEKNRVVFEDIWAEKANPEIFNRKRINQLLGTQKGITDGQVFESINDIIDFMIGANLIVHITVELDTYRGEDVNNVAYYKSTKASNQSVVKEEVKEAPKAAVNDDKLPF